MANDKDITFIKKAILESRIEHRRDVKGLTLTIISIDTKLNKRMDNLESSFDRKFNKVIDMLDAVYGEVHDMRQEQAMHQGQHERNFIFRHSEGSGVSRRPKNLLE